MIRVETKWVAFAAMVALLSGCSDSDPPAADSSVADADAAAPGCAGGFICTGGTVYREVDSGKGGCERESVYQCKEGCKVYTAVTTQPARLCKEGMPDSGVPDLQQDDAAVDDAATEDAAAKDAAAEDAAAKDAAAEDAAAEDAAADDAAADDAADAA